MLLCARCVCGVRVCVRCVCGACVCVCVSYSVSVCVFVCLCLLCLIYIHVLAFRLIKSTLCSCARVQDGEICTNTPPPLLLLSHPQTNFSKTLNFLRVQRGYAKPDGSCLFRFISLSMLNIYLFIFASTYLLMTDFLILLMFWLQRI